VELIRTAAIVPVKRFGTAKQRLSEVLDLRARAAIAEAMVSDVLASLKGVDGIEKIIVVTCDPRAIALGKSVGAEIVLDSCEAGQSAAVSLGINRAVELGMKQVLLISGDCPLVMKDDVERLLERAAALHGADNSRRNEHGASEGKKVGQALIVSDRHGQGTNALLLSPPWALKPAFGEGSFARHMELADQAGIRLEAMSLPSLEHDVDTSNDLAALNDLLVTSRPSSAQRTKKSLAEHQVAVLP
jgi:2-phospho-L-lactate guanylyltransferase